MVPINPDFRIWFIQKSRKIFPKYPSSKFCSNCTHSDQFETSKLLKREKPNKNIQDTCVYVQTTPPSFVPITPILTTLKHQKPLKTAKMTIFQRFALYCSPPGGQNPIKTYRAPASMSKPPLLQVLCQLHPFRLL